MTTPPTKWITPDLSPLRAIAMAVLDADGKLIDANAGFMHLINNEQPHQVGDYADTFFLQPTFPELQASAAQASGQIHSGLITIGEFNGQTRTLRGTIWFENNTFRTLAEHDIDEFERHFSTLLELNRDYASAQAELARANLKLQQKESMIMAISLTDPLTGIGNRRQLEHALSVEISRADRTGSKLSAIMCDFDHFKHLNDQYGHAVGDVVLVTFAKILREHTRATDEVTRFGGEEFVVLSPNTALVDAQDLAERIRATLAQERFVQFSEPVTASFGVAELRPGETQGSLLKRIDDALYAAKNLGRNRVEIG